MTVQKKFEQTKVLEAPHEQVWDVISRASGVNDWLPAITTCRLEGEGEGAKRFCETADGKYLKETVDKVDHERFVFEYTIYEQNMMPLSNYKGKYQVKKLGRDKTEITWSAVFETEEVHYPEIAQGLTGLYQMGFDGLEKLARTDAS